MMSQPSWSPYSALIFDLDNTLIVSNQPLTQRAASVLQELRHLGFIVGLATGKSYFALRHRVLPAFPKDSLHIITGGSQIIDHQGQPQWQQQIQTEVVTELVRMLLKHKAEFFIVQEKNILVSPSMVEYMTHHPLAMPFSEIQPNQTTAANVITLYGPNERILNLLSQFDHHLQFHQSAIKDGKTIFDITLKGINKASTLTEWCQMQGVSTTAVVAFGDQHNDLELLSKAGKAVTVANAVPEIKSAADLVVPAAAEDGVARYLEQVLKHQTWTPATNPQTW